MDDWDLLTYLPTTSVATLGHFFVPRLSRINDFSMQICMSTFKKQQGSQVVVIFMKYALFVFNRDSNDITLFSIFKIGIS